ncbi:N-acetylneuraminate synthase [Neptunicella sp. SCSIO 80796]|uniref:N-acetylneuraminate synthase n=1 Tax=Neptunicella plasticusilytica TaxID=3117012 RepID=UPI003A4D8336
MKSKFNQEIQIGAQSIGHYSPVFIIAEAGVNHNGDMAIAKKLVDVAVAAGADAVKFQTFKTENLILQNVEKAPYQSHTTDAHESQFNMLKKLEVSHADNLTIKAYCEQKGIIFLTTPFDEESVDDVVKLGVEAIKVASTDLTNIPFLRKIAKTGLPIFLSTGMSYLAEVQIAVSAIAEYNLNLVLLQCTANYPIADNEANLAVIETYKAHFDCLVGYSDHSVGLGAAAFAIPMGARVVEKHFTLDKQGAGPDHLASLSPDELQEFVMQVRRVEAYMGNGIKQPTLSETKTRASLQKSLVAAKPILAGDSFSADNLIAKRTGGNGISPIYFDQVLGKKAIKDFAKDDLIIL